MPHHAARRALALLALCGALLGAGCGRGGGTGDGGRAAAPAAPGTAAGSTRTDAPAGTAPTPLLLATKNTTRVGGADPVALAAGAAQAVFPGLTRASRPAAVALVDRRDWRTALAASVLMAPPLGAPLLLADGPDALPAASARALSALAPTGADAAGGAAVIRVGDVPHPRGLPTTDVAGRDPFALAQALDAFAAAARGRTSDRVIIAPAEDPAFAAPAAAYAAKSGDPILFARRGSVPAATLAALRTHARPGIFVVGPPSAVGPAAMRQLRGLGTVTRIGAADPVRSAIAFASYAGRGFGWGVVDPGHGLVLARADADPATAAAVAPLSARGTYGPLLLTPSAAGLGAPLTTYLRSIQPGYRTDPVRGVYNHGWLAGDARAISPTLQARLDTLLEIMPASPSQTP